MMEKLKTLLVADRGEIATHTIKIAKKLSIKTIAVYTETDAASHHVAAADEAVLLSRNSNPSGYQNIGEIISIAKQHKADAIFPGYGVLSEDTDLIRAASDAGMCWVGPSAKVIEDIYFKREAHQLAEQSGLSILQGSKEPHANQRDAVAAAKKIGYPITAKLTGATNRQRPITCENQKDLEEAYKTLSVNGPQSSGKLELLVEKHFPNSRHIEVQIFGNGQGKAIHLGERECSIQRRHQPIIGECPSPFIHMFPGLRQGLGEVAVRLAESLKYGSVGTVELLSNNESGEILFQGMTARLQEEYGLTELCYDVDLIELMLQQADAELCGKGGLDAAFLDSISTKHREPAGYATGARVYAENPIRDYAPSTGVLQNIEWPNVERSRIDTWLSTGASLDPSFDPLLAKVMYHSASSREEAIRGLYQTLLKTTISGPPTNLEFIAAILREDKFWKRDTIKSFLKDFAISPPVIDVVEAGRFTVIQDCRGRPRAGKGIPRSGAMDPVALQIANLLVGNPREMEGLEITQDGPTLTFFRPAVLALCGASIEVDIDSQPVNMWSRIHMGAGQTLKLGKITGAGCRTYLAIYGGFPEVAEYFGSKSTSTLAGNIGGYQGRALEAGDVLKIAEKIPEHLGEGATLPDRLTPQYTEEWEVLAMSGPHDDGFFSTEDLDTIYSNQFEVTENVSRNSIQLKGLTPKWSREGVGKDYCHPCNVIDYEYPIGALNWVDNEPRILPLDCYTHGAFVSSNTVVYADWWKLGQLKGGAKLRCRPVSFDEAVAARKHVEEFIDGIAKGLKDESALESIQPLDTLSFAKSSDRGPSSKGIIEQIREEGGRPRVSYRQGGDSYVIVEYGFGELDLSLRSRVAELERNLSDNNLTPESISAGIVNYDGGCTSLTIAFDAVKLDRAELIEHLKALESKLGDLSRQKVAVRRFRLPIMFEAGDNGNGAVTDSSASADTSGALRSLDVIAADNGITAAQVKDIFLKGTFAVVASYVGNTLSVPIDPRMRLQAPLLGPLRPYTAPGAVAWAGDSCSIHSFEQRGSHNLVLGHTIPIVDLYGAKPNFTPRKAWLYHELDQATFYEVSASEMEKLTAEWNAARWRLKWRIVEFDVAEHSKLLQDTADDVKQLREKQREARAARIKADKESPRTWTNGKDVEKNDGTSGNREGKTEHVEALRGMSLNS